MTKVVAETECQMTQRNVAGSVASFRLIFARYFSLLADSDNVTINELYHEVPNNGTISTPCTLRSEYSIDRNSLNCINLSSYNAIIA
jgi:hypothetical protein